MCMTILRKRFNKKQGNVRYIVKETNDFIAYGNFYNEKVEFVFKPNCNPKVLNMWIMLNKPICPMCENKELKFSLIKFKAILKSYLKKHCAVIHRENIDRVLSEAFKDCYGD